MEPWLYSKSACTSEIKMDYKLPRNIIKNSKYYKGLTNKNNNKLFKNTNAYKETMFKGRE